MANEAFAFPDEQPTSTAGAATREKPEEFEIETVDDTPVQDRGRAPLEKPVDEPSEDELSTYSDKVQARIKALTHARHDERRSKEAIAREKEELERFSRSLLDENKKLRSFVDTGSKQYIEQAQTLAETKVEKAKKALQEAQDAFDSEAVSKATDALMDAKIEAREAKNFRPTSLQQQETAVQTRHQSSADDEPDERTLRWQQQNQWFGAAGKDEYTSFALGLHKKLVASGLNPATDERYYEQLNARMQTTFPELFEEGQQAVTPAPSKRPASVVAPATRSSGTKKIQLTATQVALANKLNIPLQQYAAQVAKLENANG